MPNTFDMARREGGIVRMANTNFFCTCGQTFSSQKDIDEHLIALSFLDEGRLHHQIG
ncbi:hypothetical protein [Nocardia wallacei]|uniref:hypothetical protein n=1 Tax=Nocardia wallacei TaxID=480035 RepID=UPI00245528EE|nr:hypothetical protein [Nocardia wallacei]